MKLLYDSFQTRDLVGPVNCVIDDKAAKLEQASDQLPTFF